LKAPTRTAFDAGHCRLQSRSAALFIAGLCLASSGLRAENGKNSAPPRKAESAVTRTGRKAKYGTPGVKARALKLKAAKRSQSGRTRDARRRAAMRPEAQRVQEIQKALIGAGELHQEPTGKWDEATREAMRRYQQTNGFSATGLPDAKSLMKMGLGPHRLPADVATPSATSASLNRAVTSAPLSRTDNDDPPASVDPPQEHR
jgi:peptidoglycan hydrolase-like protein with peptidoglycan-binding domain